MILHLSVIAVKQREDNLKMGYVGQSFYVFVNLRTFEI